MATKTPSEADSSASAQAKKALVFAVVGVEPGRPMTIGTSTTVSSTSTRPDAVDAEGVVGAEDVDPLVGLGELEAAAELVLGGHHDRERRSVSSEKPSEICLGRDLSPS